MINKGDVEHDKSLDSEVSQFCVHIFVNSDFEKIKSAGAMRMSRNSLRSVYRNSTYRHYFELGMCIYVVTSNVDIGIDNANILAIAHSNGKFLRHDTGGFD